MMKNIAAALVVLGGAQAQMALDNCMSIVDGAFNFHWTLEQDNTITVMTETNLADMAYVAWAVPGANVVNGGNAMFPNGDAQFSMVMADGTPTVRDAVMNAPMPCNADGVGVCFDGTNGLDGMQTNTNVVGSIVEGVTFVTYNRPLTAADSTDMDIVTDDDTIFIFAAGAVVDGGPRFHNLAQARVMLSLANGPGNTCEALVAVTQAPGPAPGPAAPVVPISGAAAKASVAAVVLASASALLF